MYNLISIIEFRLRSELFLLSPRHGFTSVALFFKQLHARSHPPILKYETKVICGISPTAVPEPANRVWKEVLSASYSSSTSGNWSWDASDQSVPSTPSPPLSNDANKNFLLSPQADDVSEDVTESTHFMFEDPIPRKRKVRRGI